MTLVKVVYRVRGVLKILRRLLAIIAFTVRLKLAFCTTCAVHVLVLAQGPSFWRLRRAWLRRRGDSQDERSATVTSGGVETIQRSCSTSTEEIEVVW